MKNLYLRLSLVQLAIAALFVTHVSGVAAQVPKRLQAWQEHIGLRDSSPFRGLHWQPLGPSMQGARIEALARSMRPRITGPMMNRRRTMPGGTFG